MDYKRSLWRLSLTCGAGAAAFTATGATAAGGAADEGLVADACAITRHDAESACFQGLSRHCDVMSMPHGEHTSTTESREAQPNGSETCTDHSRLYVTKIRVSISLVARKKQPPKHVLMCVDAPVLEGIADKNSSDSTPFVTHCGSACMRPELGLIRATFLPPHSSDANRLSPLVMFTSCTPSVSPAAIH